MADDGTALGRWPSFRAALETARRGTRGHLEAFLGVAPGTSEPRRPPRGSGPREPLDLRPYGVAVLMVAVALGVAFALAQVLDVPNAPLVFIAPIVVSAVRHGRAPSLLATTLATLAYNLFFLPPLYTLTIAAPSNVVAFVCFGAVALVTSGLAARARAEMLAARTQARTAAELYAFSRTLTGTADLDGLLRATTRQIAAMLRVEAIILLPGDDGTLEVVPASSPEDQLDEADLDIARWAWEHD
jgi:two-component system, OmpR family, sensor histidine kinase KdpD